MPEHNFAPIATSYHQSILYFTENWTVHHYHVSSDQWTRCDFFNIPTVDLPCTGVFNSKLAMQEKPCFPKGLHITPSPINNSKQCCAGSINCTVLSESDSPAENVNRSYLQINLWRSSEEQFHSKVLKKFSKAECNSHLQICYLDSFSMHGRVFIIFKSIPNDDHQQNSSDSEELYDERYSTATVEVVSFDPMSGDLKDICTLSNISRCSSIVPIPCVP